ncbi:MAG: hypothetical protein JRC88_02885 [Deltaproteobacteria bacterium]|nr:hypothetical protein [Deltaproteobacteria bacterium]
MLEQWNIGFWASGSESLRLREKMKSWVRGFLTIDFDPDAGIGQKGAFCKGLPVLYQQKRSYFRVQSNNLWRRMIGYVPQVETVIIENCGHGLIFEKPKKAADAYIKFLQNALMRIS